MRNLLDFLARHNHWILFLFLEVVSFVLLFQYNSYQGSVWFSSANAVTGKVYAAKASVDQYFSLVEVNRQLTARNLYLEREVSKMAEAQATLAHDTTYLERLQRSMLARYKSIPARVVSNSLDKLDNFITIDKGSADGVKKDMGVACGYGVVGIVYLVNTHYSVVIPVLNNKSNISCSIDGRDYFGYLHWSGDAPNIAYLDDVPRHARFKIGDRVVTSGYSAVFPEGLLVGKVKKVFNSEDGLSYRVQVVLSTDFANLRDVCVIDAPQLAERKQIMEAAKDSIKSPSEN